MRIASVLLSIVCAWNASGQMADRAPGPHVIVIGIDGLSVDGVARAKTPRLHELMSTAAWTMEARGVMPTLSSPNWTSMITGAGTEQHGITSNGHLRHLVEFSPVLHDAAGRFPTMFEALRTQRPSSRIAIFHDWAGFADLVEKDAPDVLQHEHGASRTVDSAIRYWREQRPELMFVHLDNVDQSGHDQGWSSAAYYRAVEQADASVGTILDMLHSLPESESTYVLVTSDHGGKGRGHEKNALEDIQIPWILTGPEVIPGKLTAPVYTFDTAATIAWILGINLSEYAIGRPVKAAFRAPAMVAHGSPEEAAGEGCTPSRVVVTTGVGQAAALMPLSRHD